MSILVDWEIKDIVKAGQLIIEPFELELVQPNSIDVRLGDKFAEFLDIDDPIDPYEETSVAAAYRHKTVKHIWIEPGQFILGSTVEQFQLPKNIVGQLTGKSSLARLGIMVHVTAGFIDAGFSHPPATITLEIVNVGNRPVILHAGMPIAQMVFTRTLMCERAYHERKTSKYNSQKPAEPSKYFLNTKV